MRLRRQVHDVGDGVPLHHLQRGALIAQIHLLKNIFRMPGNRFQVGEVPRIGQAIEVDQFEHPHIVDDMLDQVRADKARAAGDE